jgi:adenosine deaminase
VFKDLAQHNLKQMLDLGLIATVNSDDPAYFGGYLNQNFEDCFRALPLTADDAVTLARNSFDGSFASAAEKAAHQQRIDAWIEGFR